MRLLIVDDGHYIVEYLKHLLDWKSLGVEYIETTTNSINARQILNQNEFDILITDIRMPEVSGLDLLQHVEDTGLKTKVIILSGYSQFEYAQQAVRLGAIDYLLKPVDKDDMEKAMKKVTTYIRKKKRAAPIVWEKVDGLRYLLTVISEQCPSSEEHIAVHSAVGDETFCFFKLPGAEERDEMIIRDYSREYKSFVWRTETAFLGILPASSAESVLPLVPKLVLSERFEFGQQNAVRHYFYRFFYEEKICASDLELLRDSMVFQKLEPGECELARKQIQKKLAQLETRKHQIIFLLDWISLLYTLDNKLRQPVAADWVFHLLQSPDTALPSMMLTLSQLYKDNKSTTQSIVQTIHDYIENHISEDLSLDELGKLVHLHPVYLSKLYKQETGNNLSSHISLKRLEKAAQLLTDSSLHVVDISLLVGYKKTQYFIKLFKDQYGITPYQYRRVKCETIRN